MMTTTSRTRVIRHGFGVLGILVLLTAGTSAWAEAGPVTDANIVERITVVKTRADHQAIATYYQAKATATDVTRHEAMVKAYGGSGMKTMNSHCDLLLQGARKEKVEYETLAKEHTEMAAAVAN